MKERFIKVVKYIVVIVIIGIFYAGVCAYTGFGIPCFFRKMTGLKCPGCGMTHMVLAMMRLDFRTAFLENQFVFVLMPVMAVAAAWHTVQYIKNGRAEMKKFESAACYCVIALAVVWGVVRNFL